MGVLLALTLAPTCAAWAATPEAPATDPAQSLAVGDVMSSRDRARLEALATARATDAPSDSYRIGPDDLLEIRIPDVLDAPQAAFPRALPTQAGPSTVAATPVPLGLRVSATGDVSLPYIGLVHADGLTPGALQDTIARRFKAAGILRDPQVSVQITEYRSRVVAVVGSVERPGLYPLTRPRATLADLIWAAGGPTKEAGRVVDFVPAVDDPAAGSDGRSGAPMHLDLEVLLRTAADPTSRLNPRVRPGDVITVSPAGNVQVDGWVDKPGSYPVTRGMTLTGAIAAAGGKLFPADRHRATVKRVLGPGEERSFQVDLDEVAHGRAADMPITDGDVIHLPVNTVRLVPWGFWGLVKEMVRVGGSVPLF